MAKKKVVKKIGRPLSESGLRNARAAGRLTALWVDKDIRDLIKVRAAQEKTSMFDLANTLIAEGCKLT